MDEIVVQNLQIGMVGQPGKELVTQADERQRALGGKVQPADEFLTARLGGHVQRGGRGGRGSAW